MAAADYYYPNGNQPPQAPPVQHMQPPRPQHLRPPPSQASYNSQSSLPYPISDAPPPYEQVIEPRAHSQPPPQQHVRFENHPPPNASTSSQASRPPISNANSYQYPPEKTGPPPRHSPQPSNGAPFPQQPPQNVNTHQYPPEKTGYRPSPAVQHPQGYGQPYPQQQAPPPQQQQGYYPPGPSASTQNLYRPQTQPLNPGYHPPSEPHRRRSRSRSRSHDRGERGERGDRKHHHHHSGHHSHHHRPQHPPKKNSGVNTFLGAGGGAILGDAIFPGLGTIGGAILGGLGGRSYTKQRRSYSNPQPPRMRERSYSEERDYDEGYRGRRKY